MKISKGFSVKSDGSMKVYPGANPAVNKAKRKAFINKEGLNEADMVLVDIVHSNKVVMVGEKDKGRTMPKCDGLITNVPGMILGVTAADCVPVYFLDKTNGVVGLAHAGWRGVQSGIAGEMIKLFKSEYGCLVENIEVEIGPHILDCHFEVKDDLVKNFSTYPECFREAEGVKYLRLGRIIKKQLLASGLKEENIKEATECTFCEKEKYFSYRRDKPEEIEAMLAYIVIG